MFGAQCIGHIVGYGNHDQVIQRYLPVRDRLRGLLPASAHQLARAVRELSPKTGVQSELYADALGRLDVLRENRALRTTEVREGIPSVVWVVMVSGAVITVGFTYLFAMRSFKLHAVATGALTVVLLQFTIGVLDHAFDGDVRVGPGAFELALKEMKQ